MLNTGILSLNFINKNKVGTMCGDVGNTCFNSPEITNFIIKYIDNISLHDFANFTAADKGYMFENGIYLTPSLDITFKEELNIDDKDIENFENLYKESYEEDFEDDYAPGSTEFNHALLGYAFMFLISEHGGSLRFEDAGVEDPNVREYFFETE